MDGLSWTDVRRLRPLHVLRRPGMVMVVAAMMTLLVSMSIARADEQTESTIDVSVSTVPADNYSTAQVTVTVLDGGVPVEGRTVAVSDNGVATVSAQQPVTDADGEATFTVRSGAAETVTLSATSDGASIDATAEVTFVPLATFSLSGLDGNTAGEAFDFTVTSTIQPDAQGPFWGITDGATPLQYQVSLEKDGAPLEGQLLSYTGTDTLGGDVTTEADGTAVFPADTFTVNDLTAAFGIDNTALETAGVTFPFSATLEEGEYTLEVSVQRTENAAVLGTGSATFTVGATPPPPPPPPPPPVVTAPPLPSINIGGMDITVQNQESATVAAGSPVAVSVESEDGLEATANAPAGALPAGSTLTVSQVADLEDLATLAPAPEGADLVLGFVFEVTDVNGNAIEGNFAAPVSLVFSLPAGSVTDGLPTDLVLVYWDGTAWVEVEATAAIGEDGSAVIIADVDHFTVFSVLIRPGYRAFTPAPVADGVTLTAWGGGSLEALDTAASGGSVWVFQDGEPIGYVSGAPTFVNVGFVTMFPDGLPAGTPTVVTR